MVMPRNRAANDIRWLYLKKSSITLPCVWASISGLQQNFLVVSCLFSLAGHMGRQGAGANWGKAGVLMWNLIEMRRSKVSSGAERWLCSALNDCSQQCLSASSLQADNCAASTIAWPTQGKVTLPLHHLHCVKHRYIGLGANENISLGFWMGINRCTDELVEPGAKWKGENKKGAAFIN